MKYDNMNMPPFNSAVLVFNQPSVSDMLDADQASMFQASNTQVCGIPFLLWVGKAAWLIT
ncbi:hypothetical protein I6J77_14060 [Rhodanobacter sp. FDAARGOS 1247]|uniref:hypothetical protein n=1 Tax=Rhodanobacter sp. FDAARGOS 1247 TaxID=2778082 RepID=UPI0019515D0F|nr:hypothetical protein [Rhodanobacter sp. FDAARGOS 1247]QRP63228.1 hypothetical protein I6J77_14060 [Rhodanobacter sp. FDAARGOS 1247]